MDEKEIRDSNLDNDLTDRTTNSRYQIGTNKATNSIHFSLPYAGCKLECHAEDVDRATSIFVYEGDEEEAPDSETAIVHS